MADWRKIKTEYITTDTSYRKLAQKHGVNQSTIAQRAKKENWVEQRKQRASKTQAKIIDAIEGKKVARAERLQTVADKLLGKVDSYLDQVDPVDIDTQSMKHISGVLKDIKDIQMIRADSDIREQEARIANLQKQAQKEDNDGTITVVLEGDLKKYAQ